MRPIRVGDIYKWTDFELGDPEDGSGFRITEKKTQNNVEGFSFVRFGGNDERRDFIDADVLYREIENKFIVLCQDPIDEMLEEADATNPSR